MNILVSAGLKLLNTIRDRWPMANIHEVNHINEVAECMAKSYLDLLILDVNMPGNEKLEKLVSEISGYHKVAIFSSKNENNKLTRKLMLMGAHAFLSQSATETENINILKYILG